MKLNMTSSATPSACCTNIESKSSKPNVCHHTHISLKTFLQAERRYSDACFMKQKYVFYDDAQWSLDRVVRCQKQIEEELASCEDGDERAVQLKQAWQEDEELKNKIVEVIKNSVTGFVEPAIS